MNDNKVICGIAKWTDPGTGVYFVRVVDDVAVASVCCSLDFIGGGSGMPVICTCASLDMLMADGKSWANFSLFSIHFHNVIQSRFFPVLSSRNSFQRGRNSGIVIDRRRDIDTVSICNYSSTVSSKILELHSI